MTTPWFLECLGLPAHADDRAVRRAYAVRLKQIDPEQDPAAFAQLREAYEIARAWIADDPEHGGGHEPAMTSPRPEPVASPPFIPETVAVVASEPVATPTPALANPLEQAAALLDRFAVRVAAGRDPHAELEACTAELRLQYIDAPGMFEELLVDRLAQGPLPARPTVFAAAWNQFHWHEIGHLASMGPRGGWIDAVETQRSGWSTVDAEQRTRVLSIIRGAEVSGSPLPVEIVRDWSDVKEAFQHFGTYLALFISPATLHEWASRFEQMPPLSWEITDHARPRPRARTPGWLSRVRQRMSSRWSYFVLIVVFAVARLVAEGLGIVSPSHAPSTGTPTAPAARAAADVTQSATPFIQRQPAQVRVTLAVKSRKAGRIRVTITNLGTTVVYLGKLVTPVAMPGGQLGRPIFSVVDQLGNEAPFQAMVLPLSARNPDSFYLTLEPGQTTTHDLDLAASYQLTKGKSYWVKYRQQVTTSYDVAANGLIHGVEDYVASNQIEVPVR
jgi:hypothetical protein